MPTSPEDTTEQGLGINPDGLTVNIPDAFTLSGGIPALLSTPGGVKVTILNRANKLIDNLASGYSLDLKTNKVIVNSLDPTTSRAKQHGSGSLYTVNVDPMLNLLTLSLVPINLNNLLHTVSKQLLGDTRSASDLGPKIGAGFLSHFDSNPSSESGATTTKTDSNPKATTTETGSSAQQTGSFTQTGLSPTQTSSPVTTAAIDSKTQTGPSTNTGLSPTQTSSPSATTTDSQTQTGSSATSVETQTPSPAQTISDMTTTILPWFTIPDSLETESQEAEEFKTEGTTPASTPSIGTTNPITDNPFFKSLTTTGNLTPRTISAADFVKILNYLFGGSDTMQTQHTQIHTHTRHLSREPSREILEDFEEVVRDLTPDGSGAGSTMDA
ncbi:uncharacterized protein [Littorina saxatilis]|uniref:uncharacterized protein n=1 Tax=Littorina saxatilis TaxID=31220 RepID=UPI0038B66F05